MLKTEGGMRESLAEFLPDALAKALASYRDFCDREDQGETAKDFKAHHESCKAAISHVELLLKLAEKFEVVDMPETGDGALAKMIENARSEVSSYKGR